ncbi:hypothetical protein [Sorangium sp. So ce887]|uniref:hypothetical protein n=1 Tax=Sorangium sp. So ce887 TaxID=3133324 RepID=UPI003F62E912
MSLRVRVAVLAIFAVVAGGSCTAILGIHDVTEDQQPSGGGGSGHGGGGSGHGGGGPGHGGGGGGGGVGTACEPGQPVACYDGAPATKDVGQCKSGSRPCEDAAAPCEAQVLPAAEDCAARGDEDCDGSACGDTTWAEGFGNAEHQGIVDIAADAQGNVYLLGNFEGTMTFGQTTLVPSGQGDAYLAKLSPDGAPLWAKSYMAQPIVGLDVAPSGDVGVSLFSPGEGQSIEGTPADGFVVFTLSPEGTARWVNACGGRAGYETIRRGDVSFAPDGSLLALEVFSGPGCLAQGETGTLVGSFDAAGALGWTRQVDGDAYGRVGGIAALGPSRAFLMALLRDIQPQRHVLVEVKESYATLTLASFNEYVRWPVVPDGFGGAVAAGDFSGTLTIRDQTRTAVGERDAFVARFSAEGVLTWLATFPGVQVTGLAVGGNGVFMAGTFSDTAQIGDAELVSKGLTDVWLARVSLGAEPTGLPGGAFEWARSYGGFESDENPKVAANQNAVYLAAEFGARADFGGEVLSSNGGSDIAVVRIEP